MRARLAISAVAVTLLVAAYPGPSSSVEAALWNINAHAASMAKAQWQQVYWLKRQVVK